MYIKLKYSAFVPVFFFIYKHKYKHCNTFLSSSKERKKESSSHLCRPHVCHADLLSRLHFNKQGPGSDMCLNGCILLLGSEQTVCGGACQLLPTGCCSMWKQWVESAFDASPSRSSLPAPLFFCLLFDGVLWSVRQRQEANISTPTQEKRQAHNTQNRMSTNHIH